MSVGQDVIVIGAGPAGSATAHYLAQQGLGVLLLDKASFPRDKTCGDAVTPRGLGVLQDMGILGELLRHGCRVNSIEVFAPGGNSTTGSFPPGTGLPDYALVIPRLLLDQIIWERAVASGARFHGGIRVTGLESGPAGVEVFGEWQGRLLSFRAPLAVLATGVAMKLGQNLGLLRATPPLFLAARAYYENVPELRSALQFHFDGVPLPGYGWVFPAGEGMANVGAGFLVGDGVKRPRSITGAAVLDNFVNIPPLRRLLVGANLAGPVRGYPLRVDFPASPTSAERLLLVGEAAGLVNPLTGEGIDYALESGRLAAEQIAAMLAAGDLSRARLREYDAQLRQRFQRLFVFCRRIRNILLRPVFINPLVNAANRQPDLKAMLIDIILGRHDFTAGFPRKVVLQAALTIAAEFI